METYAVTMEIIYSPHAEAYFTRADRRVMIGLRATLEMLDLPVPDYARRRMTGPSPAKATRLLYAADNATPRATVLPERKANASLERVAAAQADRAMRLSGGTDNLFNQFFPGLPAAFPIPDHK